MMKTLSDSTLTWCIKGIFLLLLAVMYSCDHMTNSDAQDRNNSLDADNAKRQHQDSVNRMLNDQNSEDIDTLPEGLRE